MEPLARVETPTAVSLVVVEEEVDGTEVVAETIALVEEAEAGTSVDSH